MTDSVGPAHAFALLYLVFAPAALAAWMRMSPVFILGTATYMMVMQIWFSEVWPDG